MDNALAVVIISAILTGITQMTKDKIPVSKPLLTWLVGLLGAIAAGLQSYISGDEAETVGASSLFGAVVPQGIHAYLRGRMPGTALKTVGEAVLGAFFKGKAGPPPHA